MTDSFRPWRRDVAWGGESEIAVEPLLERLSFSAGRSLWGYALRFGLLRMTPEDHALIASAMAAAAA